MFHILGKDTISEDKSNVIEKDNLIVEYTIDDYWKIIAGLLDLKLINPGLSLYENEDGIFILSKYGFIKQISGL